MKSQYLKKRQLPDSPGVYFFLGRNKKILYIGKAGSLRDRVRSYFSTDLFESRSPLILKMVKEAISLDFKKTDSVLEALILEVDLIKKFRPPYNTKEKDDRSFNCLVITKEDFPRVLVVRQRDLSSPKLLTTHYPLQTYFGPFPNAGELRTALGIVRKIFPYRDKCEPIHSDVLKNIRIDSITGRNRGCFNYQIGLCPGVCVGAISKTEYSKTIRHLKLFFAGKKTALFLNLQKEMKILAKEHEFEKAGLIKRQVFALRHIQDVALIKTNNLQPTTSDLRLEAYDVAHLGGGGALGVMVVWVNGRLDNSQYRIFNLKATKAGDDLGGLKEILVRRLKHSEWPLPAAIIVDGGEGQRRLATEIIRQESLTLPVIAVTKDENHKPKSISGKSELVDKLKKEILQINAEAHRFAIKNLRRRLKSNFLD